MQTIHFINSQPDKKLKVAFINPPVASNWMFQPLTWILMKSYYEHNGAYPENVDWLAPPYKWDTYKDVADVWEEIKDADIFLFSSYVWNYAICDKIAAYVKEQNKSAICVVGGPHIGENDDDFLRSRSCYDYICKATKPGEIFIADLLNAYLSSGSMPSYDDISWELRGNKKCGQYMQTYSVYEENIDFLIELNTYAKRNILFENRTIIFESTSGCPFSCTYCEWGGGTGSKVARKEIDLAKKDLDAIAKAGYELFDFSNANFGIDKEKDIAVFEYAWSIGLLPFNVSTLKVKSLERKKELYDDIIEIVAKHKDKIVNIPKDFIPPLSIQTVNNEAQKIANRVDMSLEDKLTLSRYLGGKTKEIGIDLFPEFIAGMPGSTLDDFYNEFDISFEFLNCGEKYIYLILPDCEISQKDFLDKHDIKLVDIYYDDNRLNDSIYKYSCTQKTISSCFSYTKDEMCEMWIMNTVAHFMYSVYRKSFSGVRAADFMRECWEVLKTTPNFSYIWDLVNDIFDPETPPRHARIHYEVDIYFAPFELYIEQRLQQRFKNEIITRV